MGTGGIVKDQVFMLKIVGSSRKEIAVQLIDKYNVEGICSVVKLVVMNSLM